MFNLHWETRIHLYWFSLIECSGWYYACPSSYPILMQLISPLATHMHSVYKRQAYLSVVHTKFPGQIRPKF